MPHIIIEHSHNALTTESKKVLNKLHESLIPMDLFKPANIKLRLHPVMDFLLDDRLRGFIHIQCRTHSGKSMEQKSLLSETLVKVMANICSENCVITCEIVEMDSVSYAKTLS